MPPLKLKLIVAPDIRLINFGLNLPMLSPSFVDHLPLVFWHVFVTGVFHHLVQIIVIVLFTPCPYRAPVSNKHPVVGPFKMLVLRFRRLDSVVPLSGHIWPRMHLEVGDVWPRIYNILVSLQIIVVYHLWDCVDVRSTQLRFVLLLSHMDPLLDRVLPFQVLSLVDVVDLQRHVEEVRVHVHRRSNCYLGSWAV